MIDSRTRRQDRHLRSGRRWVAVAAIAAVSAGSVLAAQPAAAEGSDSWRSIPPNPVADVYRFTVPTSAATAAVGTAPALVAVEGNFGPGKSWSQLNMSSSGGNWTGTIGPLEPGLYYYQYEATVAGTEALVGFRNPASPQEVTSKPTWNTFFVPGAGAEWLADVSGGGELEPLSYAVETPSAEEARTALAWTPPGYDADRAEPYPVLYLLQDEGQSHREWVELGRLTQILDNLTIDGDIEPMVVVMADGGTAGDTSVEVVDGLLPAAEQALNVSSDSADRAIAGIGRGGSQALDLLVDAPGEFSKVGAFSAGLGTDITGDDAAQINDATDLIRLYTGNVTDPAYNATVAAAETLAAAGVEFQSDGYDPETGGTWDTWQKSLHDFASRAFSGSDDTGPSEGHLPLTSYTAPAPGTTPTPIIDANGVVTFETGTEYAAAKNVTVWANWGPAGNWLRIPMVKQSDDRWRLTVGPLEGGSYYYKLIVDRVDKKDVNNPTSTISEVNWSTFYVPGTNLRGEFTGDVAAQSRGAVTVMNYTSTANNAVRQANVWTPPGFDADREVPYPVLFLQHGGGQTWSDWVDVGRAAQILDHHLLEGNIEPMVVVMANGNGVNFQNELYQRLVPAAEEQFNTSSQPGERAIAGLSMGSGLAMTALYSTPGQFAYVGAFSAFSNPPANADVAAINAGTRLLRVYSGDIQDFTYPNTVTMISQLQSRGINHEFAPLIPGPHSWDVWQKALIDFLPRIFTHVRPVFAAGGETQSVAEGQNLAFAVEATDADGETLTYSAGPLPTGATFDPTTREFSWTPGFDQAGSYEVTFTAKDGTSPYSLSATRTVTITVDNAPQVAATASVRCVAGKALVSVVANNTDPGALNLTVTSTYGTKSFTGIAAGKSATHAFTTRLAAVPGGAVTVTATATGGASGTTSVEAAYPATSCN